MRLAAVALSLSAACTSPAPGPSAVSQPAAAPAGRGTSPETRGDVDADGVIRRGEPVDPAQAMTVEALFEAAERVAGETVTVTGEVTKVCAKKGCWMAIRGEEGGPSVRITAKDYAYFVPMDATGRVATVRGEVSVRTLDAKTAQHYAEDARQAGEVAPEGDAGSREVAVLSVGLEILR